MKKAYEEAVINNTVEAFLKDNGCDATIEDIKDFFKELQGDKALSEEDIDKIAGGVIALPMEFYNSESNPWICDPTYSDTGIDPGTLTCL